MIRVNSRASRREDHAGDPLDGLVNMFDIGIVLSLGFLIAALSALKLSSAITDEGLRKSPDAIRVDPDAQVSQVPTDGTKVVGQGTQVGKVYRLNDGRLIYVVEPSASASATPTPTP